MWRLSSSAVACATIRLRSSTAIRSASWSSSSSPTWCGGCAGRADCGLIKEDHPRRADQRHRQVQPPAHPTGVGGRRPPGRVDEVQALQQLGHADTSRVAAQVLRVGHQAHVLLADVAERLRAAATVIARSARPVMAGPHRRAAAAAHPRRRAPRAVPPTRAASAPPARSRSRRTPPSQAVRRVAPRGCLAGPPGPRA
jgi:hypothetical protein